MKDPLLSAIGFSDSWVELEMIREELMVDMVNKPPHYNSSKIQAIEVIEDWDLGFNLGTVLKYVQRYRLKGTPILDLKKAAWYLNREIENMEKNNGEENRPPQH